MAKLLIVEDDLILDEAYRKKYSGQYDIRVETEGEGGIKAIKSWKPDVVLLDLYLPGKSSGLDVLSFLKKDVSTARIPVLVITNLPDATEKVKAMGADECFMKTDVDLDLIEKSLRDILTKATR
ncbi:MAG TPA: response regulator [Candidatus Woesebacteria bacterium]|nr:response regulator [Candidatus Woesebacteria bacterium]